MPRRHVVITGTGRCGTSFLVELLSNLGLDTGFAPENIEKFKSKLARAGLEHDIRNPNAPYIVKTPWFCDYADEVVARDDIQIDHVFIPMRDLKAAAESRRFVTASAVRKMPLLKRIRFNLFPKHIDGGVTVSAGQQETELLRQVYDLTLALSKTMIPVTLMRFPQIVEDASYLFQKLQPILDDITFPEFETTFTKVARRDLVHSFSENDR